MRSISLTFSTPVATAIAVVTVTIVTVTMMATCFADPIPVSSSTPPTHVMFVQLAIPISINYGWNFLILGAVFRSFGIKVKTKRFSLFTLLLTLTGLAIDVAAFIFKIGFNFFGWALITAASLFILSFTLAKFLYKLPKRKSVVSGLVYAVASHPIIGITFVIPLLAKFSLVPQSL